MRRKNQIYEVEIKSNAILKEKKKGLITYFKGGNKKTIVMNVQHLYPQYTRPEDKPLINITPISYKEYKLRLDGGAITQKRHLVEVEGNVI